MPRLFQQRACWSMQNKRHKHKMTGMEQLLVLKQISQVSSDLTDVSEHLARSYGFLGGLILSFIDEDSLNSLE